MGTSCELSFFYAGRRKEIVAFLLVAIEKAVVSGHFLSNSSGPLRVEKAFKFDKPGFSAQTLSSLWTDQALSRAIQFVTRLKRELILLRRENPTLPDD
jgi:hypothetical protein